MSISKPDAHKLSLFFLRLVMGWYFAFAGWRKVSGELNNGLGSFFQGDSFQNRQPDFIPDLLMAPYGYALPWAELIFGLTLLLGLFHRISSSAVQIMLITIGIALLFSGELFPTHHVLVFIPALIILQLQGPGAFNLDRLIAKK
ncbi:MAG: DoxX family membrane protein [Opitutales bacterium]|nr:DoxX family membrane protein [Opitutales bacterium]